MKLGKLIRCAFFLSLDFIVLKSSYSQQNLKEVEVRIDLSQAIGRTASKVFDSIRYIPLETNKNSLFSNIDQLIVTPEYFIILDFGTQSILVFNKDGKFYSRIKQIGNVKGGPGKLASFDMFGYMTFDSENNYLLVTSHVPTAANSQLNNKIHFFKLDGTLVKSIDISSWRALYRHFQYVPSQKLLYYKKQSKDIGEADIYLVDYKNELIDKYCLQGKSVNLNLLRGGVPSGFSMFQNSYSRESSVFIRETYSLYKILDGKPISKLQFVFPIESSMPSDFFLDTLKWSDRVDMRDKKSRIGYINTNANVILDFNFILWQDNFIHFVPVIQKRTTQATGYIYNLSSGILLDMNKFRPDDKNGMMPIPLKFISLHNGRFYSYLSAAALSNALEKRQNANSKNDKLIQSFLQNRNKNKNPVIVETILSPKLSK